MNHTRDPSDRVPTPRPARRPNARRLTRERERLLKELLRYTNRIKGLLAGLGIYDFEPLGADPMRDRAETAAETAHE